MDMSSSVSVEEDVSSLSKQLQDLSFGSTNSCQREASMCTHSHEGKTEVYDDDDDDSFVLLAPSSSIRPFLPRREKRDLDIIQRERNGLDTFERESIDMHSFYTLSETEGNQIHTFSNSNNNCTFNNSNPSNFRLRRRVEGDQKSPSPFLQAEDTLLHYRGPMFSTPANHSKKMMEVRQLFPVTPPPAHIQLPLF